MSVEIAWKQNILVTDFQLLKSLLVVVGFGLQAFVCGFSRQNINSVFIGRGLNASILTYLILGLTKVFMNFIRSFQNKMGLNLTMI